MKQENIWWQQNEKENVKHKNVKRKNIEIKYL